MHTSNTVTVKLQLLVLPEPSVAVHVTVVMPRGRHEPEGGLHAAVTPGQLSEAVAAKVATAHGEDEHTSWGVIAVKLAGQVITGAWVSFTVTVNVHIEPLDVVTVTVVVPFGKKEPEAGLALCVPHEPEIGGITKLTTAPH